MVAHVRVRRLRGIVAIVTAIPLLCVTANAASGSSLSPSSVQMTPVTLARVPGTQIVYVMGYVKCGPQLCLRLARTSDHGASFTAVTPPRVRGGTQLQYVNRYELVFANREVGFAEVGLVSPSTYVVTFDGAKTWRKEQVPFGNRIEGFVATSKNVYAVTAKFEKKLNQGDGGYQDYRLALVADVSSVVEHVNTEQQLHVGFSRTHRGLWLSCLDLRTAPPRSLGQIA